MREAVLHVLLALAILALAGRALGLAGAFVVGGVWYVPFGAWRARAL